MIDIIAFKGCGISIMSLLQARDLDMVGICYPGGDSRGVKKHVIYSKYVSTTVPDRYFNPARIAKYLPDNLKAYATTQCYYFKTNQINASFRTSARRLAQEIQIFWGRVKIEVPVVTFGFFKPSEEELNAIAREIADSIIKMYG